MKCGIIKDLFKTDWTHFRSQNPCHPKSHRQAGFTFISHKCKKENEISTQYKNNLEPT